MDFEKIISELEAAQKEKFVKFVSDKGANSCHRCLQQNGKIYEENDAEKPVLPIHPHCHCCYEPVDNPHLEKTLCKWFNRFKNLDNCYPKKPLNLSQKRLICLIKSNPHRTKLIQR